MTADARGKMFGVANRGDGTQRTAMAGFLGSFTGDADAETFDPPDAFVPEHLPDPGPFLAEGQVLTGEEHRAFHRETHDRFEERGVYDVTFGYNLAELNRDRRHPEAGYRYAEEPDDDVLRAEFTPTTPFCPQSRVLTTGSFRAWNESRGRLPYDLVRVRVAPSHQESGAINDALETLEEAVLETGTVPPPGGGG